MAFYSCTSDLGFSPLFRLLDDYETHLSAPAPTKASRCKSTSTSTPAGSTPTRVIRRTVFTPAFDVRELNDAYYLDGELPGVDQSNIEIEFTDPQTLVVKGRTERNYASTSAASPQVETETETEPRGQDTPTTSASTSRTPSPSWHQPTVEDDDEDDARSTSSSASASSKHSTSSGAVIVEKPSAPAPAPATSSSPSDSSSNDYYWVAERSIGEFQRTFAFTARVDQDGVRAALKNGILSIVVPKEAAPKTKKIRIY